MDALFIFLQKVVPQKLISRLAGRLAESTWPTWKDFFISRFVAHYDVDLSEAECESPQNFANFNAFFTRALKPGARPLCKGKDSLACPADGAISQIGKIVDGKIFQAKGHHYTAKELLGGDDSLATQFCNGHFATTYLSPKDYHRVHSPTDAVLQNMIHVPGELFSVNTVTAENIEGLFARNERVVATFSTDCGPMAVVLVGAMIVASIETTWAGLVAPGAKHITRTDYDQSDEIKLEKGGELGRFKLGSTVILLFPENTISWSSHLIAGAKVQMGQEIGTIRSATANSA